MIISSTFRRVTNGYTHWCPGCQRMHLIPDTWEFDDNAERPTFSPSIKIIYNGPDAGQARPDGGRAPQACCHYFLRAGELQFCSDSTHALAGKTVSLPALPFEDLSMIPSRCIHYWTTV